MLAGQSVKRYEWPRFSSERPSVDSNDPRRENLVAVGAATQRPKDDGGLVCLQCLYGPSDIGFRLTSIRQEAGPAHCTQQLDVSVVDSRYSILSPYDSSIVEGVTGSACLLCTCNDAPVGYGFHCLRLPARGVGLLREPVENVRRWLALQTILFGGGQ